MKKIGLLLSLIITSVTGALCAATPGWTGGPMSATGDTIVDEGELVYAVAGGHTDGNSLGEITVNGVPFTTIKSLTDYPSSQYSLPFSVSPTIKYDASGLNNQGTTGDYAQMLEKGFWNSVVGEYTFTLNGLEAGNTYLVQIVCHRDTTGYSVVAPGGAASIQTGKGEWTYGGSLVGVFNATGSSYTFTINYVSSDGGSKAHFNAFQVRKLSGAEPTPVEPSIGSVTKSVSGSAATISLADVVMGTDDECVDATSYSVWYSLTNAPAVEALAGQTGSSAAFTLNDLADGHYTCSVTISNDVGKVSAAKSVEFDVNVSGAPILGWTAEPMSSSGDTVRTDGTLLYAYGQAWPTKTTYTVNTVPFSADDGIYGGKCSTTIGYRADSTPPSDVSGDYAALLQYGWWGDEGEQTFTLNGLTAGKNYLVQIVMRHPDCGVAATAPDGTVAKAHGDGWEYGGSLIYVFTAKADFEKVVITYSGARAYFNAIQVREIENAQPPAPVVVKPSIGSVSKSVKGADATITLGAVEMGTDDECVAAFSYSVSYSLNGADAVEVLTGQRGNSAAFTIKNLEDGHYVCSVTITSDKGKTSAAKSVEFDVNVAGALTAGWTAEPMDNDGKSIRTDGQLLYAFGSSHVDITYEVNGVGFVGYSEPHYPDPLPGFYASSFQYRTPGVLPSGISGDYNKLLAMGYYENSGSPDQTITLMRLIPGKSYLAQIIFCSSENWLYDSVTAGGATVKLSGDGWSRGGSLIYVFKATDATETIPLHYLGSNKKAFFNALQVRMIDDLPSKPVNPSVSAVSVRSAGSSAIVSLEGVEMGTDDDCVAASSYSVFCSLDGADAVEVLSGQDGAANEFVLTDLTDGNHTCEVTITTDKGKTSAVQSAEFTISASASPVSDVRANVRFAAICGVPTDDISGDVGEWIVLTNLANAAVDLNGARVVIRKTKNGVADGACKCEFTFGDGLVLPANGSVRLNQRDFTDAGWEKISNGEISLMLFDAEGSLAQSSSIGKSKNTNGALCIATSFVKTTSDGDWTVVPAGATDDPSVCTLVVTPVVNASDATLVESLKVDISSVGAGRVVMAWGGMNRGDDPSGWLGSVDLGEVAAGQTELFARAPVGFDMRDSKFACVKFFFTSDGTTYTAVSAATRVAGLDWLTSENVRRCGEVVINEFMAKNSTVWGNAEGVTNDWIEIKNVSGYGINLSGWGVSDKASKPFKQTIPAGVILPAGGIIVLSCDGTNTVCSAGEVHLSLSLGTDAGEYLSLTDPNGKTWAALTYPQQIKDRSYGLKDGAYVYFKEPTPGLENTSKAYSAITPKVEFSVPHGYKTEAFELTISCPDDDAARIYYTLDGSSPVIGNGKTLEYTGAISVTKTTVIRAAVPDADSVLQQDNSATYIFVDDVLNAKDGVVPEGFPASGSIPDSYHLGGEPSAQRMVYGMAAVADADARDRMIAGLTNSIRTVSIVIDPESLFGRENGIYVHPRGEGRDWERQTMIEQINPVDGETDEFTVPAGLKIRGAGSRSTDYPKHAFHVIFRSEYGMGSLEHPLFGAEGADSFERIDFRCSQNYAFANGSDYDTYIHDVFSRDTQRDMGEPYHRSRYYNLFINGVYWGVYQTEERMCQDYAATYNGAEPEDYDVVRTEAADHYNNHVVEGESETSPTSAWRTLWDITENQGGYASGTVAEGNYNRVRGLNADGSRNSALPVLLNVTNTITHMLIAHFVGDSDAPAGMGPAHALPNNHAAFRCRIDGLGKRDGFIFNRHDCEHGLGFGYENDFSGYDGLASYKTINTILNGTVALYDTWLVDGKKYDPWLGFATLPKFGTAELHYQLMKNDEYRMTAADLVYKHVLKKGGSLTPEVAEARYRGRMGEVEDAIELEIARWRRHGGSAKPNAHKLWEDACAINLEFIAKRAPYYIQQLRDLKWYPSIDAPEVTVATDGESATLSSKDAGVTIYYTTNGSDPRLEGGAVSASAEVYTDAIPVAKTGMKIKARARSASGEWSALQEEGLKASADDGYTFYYTGAHDGDIVIDASVWPDVTNECTVIFDNANVNGKLVLANDIRVALVLSNDTVNTIKTIEGPGAHLRLAGADGELKLEGAGTLVSVSNLVVKSGTLSVKTTEIAAEDVGNKTKVIEVLGHVKQTGGVIDVDIGLESEDQICGIYLKNKDLKDSKDNNLGIIYAEFSGGEFRATVGGTKSAAIFVNKGSVDTKFIGEFEADVTLVGPQARFVSSAGDIKLQGGEITVAGEESATDARVFKSDKKINIKGGEYWINAVGQGSEIFSSSINDEDPKTSSITITDGRFHLVAADDCFSADNLIQIDGGLVYAKSLYDDVFDSNGDMIVNGGTILAYATAEGHEAFDVEPYLTASYGSSTFTVNGGVIFATGGRNAAWPAKTGVPAGKQVFTGTGLAASDYSEKYLSLAGSGDVTYTAKLPAMSGTCAVFATCPGFGGMPTFSGTAPTSGDMEFHDFYIVEAQASNQEFLRVYEIYGSTTGDGDTGEYIVLTNTSDKTILLQGFAVKTNKKGSAPKLSITLGNGTVEPYGTVKLTQADYSARGWGKITNGDIEFQLSDAKGNLVQSGATSFKLFADTDGAGASLIAIRFVPTMESTTEYWRSSSSEPPPAAPDAPVIGGDGIADPIVVESDKVTITIGNAAAGFVYGYRKSATLAGLATAEVTWLTAPASADGILAIEIEKNPADPACFYQILVK